MKYLFIPFLLLSFAQAQRIDTIIKMDNYTSYFSYQLHEPLYVEYKLYKGGGNCSRVGVVFTTGGLKESATAKDYKGGGYDEGHLVNSKDFAYDCTLQKNTFRFYNCVPQTPRLNRGIWKTWETTIRKESQTDSLLIFCGSIFGKKLLKNIGIPDKCWKVVYSLTTKKITHCLIFDNDNSNAFKNIKIGDLILMIGYKIKFTSKV